MSYISNLKNKNKFFKKHRIFASNKSSFKKVRFLAKDLNLSEVNNSKSESNLESKTIANDLALSASPVENKVVENSNSIGGIAAVSEKTGFEGKKDDLTDVSNVSSSEVETKESIKVGSSQNNNSFESLDAKQRNVIVNATKKNRPFILISDGLRLFFTWLFTGITFMSVVAIVIFIFQRGWSTLNWDFFSGNYKSEQKTLRNIDGYVNDNSTSFTYDAKQNEFFSKRWGIALTDSRTNDGLPAVKIVYIDPDSPLIKDVENLRGEKSEVTVGWNFAGFTALTETDGVISVGTGTEKPEDETVAQHFAVVLDDSMMLTSINTTLGGDGFRGSFISTIYTILLTLLFALPLGIGGAIYLGVYSKPNKFTNAIRVAIDLLSGVPSIIFGLIGALIFIPITSGGGTTGSILSGSLTLAIMVLPIIIKNTEEAIKVIPKSLTQASLALGASQSQTIFKITIPNAMSGILTGTILAMGRIIGESASLIFAVGISIQDNISILSPATTMATHIWYVMAGENPNYAAACAISIVILFIVLILNILLSMVSHYLNRFNANASETWFTKMVHKIQKSMKAKKEAKQNV